MRYALGLVILAGCASGIDWVKPGATRAAMEADAEACNAAARSYPTRPRKAASPTPAEPSDADRQLDLAERVGRCMADKGYTLR